MSSVSNIYDDILTELSSVFSSKTRIPNAYSLLDNPETYLRDSYGLRVDPAAPSSRDITVYTRERNFAIILTREVIKTDVQTSQFDTAVKNMLEDVNTLQKEFLGSDQFDSYDNIDIVRQGGFSGIQFFLGERSNFITTEVIFSIMISNLY